MEKYAQTAKRKISAVHVPETHKRESEQQDRAQQDRAQVVRNGVVSAILEHRLHPGTKLGEDDLGKIYGVSRTLVRLALQTLAREGIVVIKKNRGAFVTRPSIAQTKEVFEARRLIEPAIAARAAQRATPAFAKALDAHLIEEAASLARHDEQANIRLSGDFHLLVAQMSGHSVFQSMLGELITRSSLSILMYKSSREHLCGVDHHREIADAIVSGNGARAGSLMVHHLDEIEHGLELKADSAPRKSLERILAAR